MSIQININFAGTLFSVLMSPPESLLPLPGRRRNDDRQEAKIVHPFPPKCECSPSLPGAKIKPSVYKDCLLYTSFCLDIHTQLGKTKAVRPDFPDRYRFSMMSKAEPLSLWLVTFISPPWRSTISFTTDKPNPEPGICWERAVSYTHLDVYKRQASASAWRYP